MLHKSGINDATCAAMSRGCLGCLAARVEIFRYKKIEFVNYERAFRRFALRLL